MIWKHLYGNAFCLLLQGKESTSNWCIHQQGTLMKSLNNLLNKHSSCWRFDMPWHSCDVTVMWSSPMGSSSKWSYLVQPPAQDQIYQKPIYHHLVQKAATREDLWQSLFPEGGRSWSGQEHWCIWSIHHPQPKINFTEMTYKSSSFVTLPV